MSSRPCYHFREGDPGAEGDPCGGSALTDPGTVLQGPAMVSETGADDRVHQQPQTRQGMNQVRGPSREPSQGQKEIGPWAGLETRLQVGSKSSQGMRLKPGFGADL